MDASMRKKLDELVRVLNELETEEPYRYMAESVLRYVEVSGEGRKTLAYVRFTAGDEGWIVEEKNG